MERSETLSGADALPSPATDTQIAHRASVALFAATMFTASCLLFFVQPMFAKQLLPRLGGSPAVWNTCVLFFQTVLLLGYLYAHVAVKWLGRWQPVVHVAIVLLPIICLPLSTGDVDADASSRPVLWLLQTLTLRVGLPFFALTTTAPLLQRWFSTLPLAAARDPYFLYASSNLGSMLALLAYPLAIEPWIGLARQSSLWAAGYALFVVLMLACVGTLRAFGRSRIRSVELEPVVPRSNVTSRDRAWWVLLAFVPSSLMLGVTMHISTDIASVPLMWVGPLALYLLTFVIAFSSRTVMPAHRLTAAGAVLCVTSLVTVFMNAQHAWLITLHLATFFCSALICHSELAARRPYVTHLTEFYLWMSFGGMLGGVFNSLVAPYAFATVFEYPLILAVVVIILPLRRGHPGTRWSSGLTLAAAALACLALFWTFGAASPDAARLVVAVAAAITVPLVAAHGLAAVRLLAVALVVMIGADRSPGGGTALVTDRSFFGVVRVVESPDLRHRVLRHGSTMHGWQSLPNVGCEPSSYYSARGPIGDVMRASAARRSAVAVIGLGTGALACYAASNERWTFYEIDPLIEKVARDTRLFTHLAHSSGKVDIRLGDGRMTLARAAPGEYDVLVLDAFSSDAIPVHLLTVEAFDLYFSRLQPAGVLAVHVSNRHLDLEPLIGAIIEARGLYGMTKEDRVLTEEEQNTGRRPSHWVAAARTPSALATLGAHGWRALRVDPEVEPWTDDYSDIISLVAARRRNAAGQP